MFFANSSTTPTTTLYNKLYTKRLSGGRSGGRRVVDVVEYFYFWGFTVHFVLLF